jgi:hypothetical protein
VLRDCDGTAGEHQQTDDLEQQQRVIFIGHASDQAICVPEAADCGEYCEVAGVVRLKIN